MAQAATIDQLQLEIQSSATTATAGLDALTGALTRIKSIAKGGAGLTTISKQLNAFSASIKSMADPTAKIASLVYSLSQLGTIDKSNLGSTLNQLKKIPEITAGLDDTKLSAFADKIKQVTAAVLPLSTEMEKVSAGFSRLPANIQKAINANAKLTSSNNKASRSFFQLGNIMAQVYIVKRIANVIGNWITESNAYVENLNLFTVAMGEYADSALEYANEVSEAMGIDQSEWIRNQGVFQTLLTGFGNSGERAAIMSKNLTQLGYDLSSFFNITFADSMQKLQSGVAGELEPLRRLGYDLSIARLQQEALNLGITKSVSAMTQAEKSQLRYYAIMTQVTTAQGDMARTLQAPANQLRILKAQATQAARALGNIFIPALNAVLPYAIAFLKVLRTVANEMANLFGFELPEIDYSGLNAIETSAEDGTEAVEELKNALLGFDELNILHTSANGLLATSGNVLDFTLPEYDFLGDLVENRADELAKKLEEPFKNVLKLVGLIGAAMLLWKIGTDVASAITGLQNLSKNGQIALGITLLVTGITLETQGLNAIAGGTATWLDYVKTLLGAVATAVGGKLLLGVAGVSGPMGWAISIAVTIIASLVEISIANDKALTEAVESGFYSIGDGITISNIAIIFDNATATLTTGMDDVISMSTEIETLKSSIMDTNAEIELIDDAWAAGVLPSEEYVTQLTSLIEQLETDTADVLERVKNNIINATAGAFGIALTESGKSAEELIKIISGTIDAAQEDLIAWSSEYNSLAQKVLLGTATESDIQRMSELRELISGLSGTAISASAEFSKLNDAVGNIDWESPEDVAAFIESINTTSKTAADNLKAYWDGIEESLRIALATAKTDEAKKVIQDALDIIPDEAEQQAGLAEYLNTLLDIIQNDFVAKVPDMMDEAKKSWDSMSPIQKLLRGNDEEAYIYNYVYKYANETIPGILDQLAPAFEAAGIDITNTASETIGAALNSIFIMGESTVYLPQSLSQDVIDDLKAIGIDITEWANANEIVIEPSMDTGKITMATESALEATGIAGQAMAGSITLSNTNAWNQIKTIWGAAPGWFEKNVTLPIKGFFADAFNGITDIVNAVIRGLNKIQITLPDWSILGELAGLSFGISIPEISKITTWSKYGTYAEGGFPPTGDLFIANENGKSEFVGSMGNKAAVANNDQIVEGVASGVASANSEQNALLREQNRLLKVLVEQDRNVVFPTSPEAGRAISNSITMYNKARGTA